MAKKRKPLIRRRSCGHTLYNQDPNCPICNTRNKNLQQKIRTSEETIKAQEAVKKLPQWAIKVIFEEDDKNEYIKNYLQKVERI